MKKAFVALTAVLALALTGCAAPEVTNTPDGADKEQGQKQDAAKAAKVGDKITLAGSDEELKIAVTVLKVVNTKSTDEFTTPEKGNRFVAVRLALKNVGSQAYDDSPSNGAKLIDADDQQYDAALVTGVAAGPLLDTVKLAPGKGRQGVIVFSVPKKTKLAGFQFALDSGFAPQTGEWTLG
ncbi:DUF4352 domain-containing protein [Actinocorallia sp. B10E7]|uniref:DUF4352 domain-containing protein n=1 Tax=Actinocorallia sp. B10E7 TaxID=3153558 RepID=UPI00325F5FCE